MRAWEEVPRRTCCWVASQRGLGVVGLVGVQGHSIGVGLLQPQVLQIDVDNRISALPVPSLSSTTR